MELLQKRDFGAIFNDTFEFLRLEGKHFFKNYLLINTIPLIILLLLFYFASSSIYGLNTQAGPTGLSNVLTDYMNNNFEIFSFSLIILFIVLLVFSIIQYSYTAIYMILYLERGSKNFDMKDIFREMFQKKIRKIIIFILALILISIPVIIISAIVGIVLLITIIGIFGLIAFLSMWYTMAFVEYLSTNKNVFECFGVSWNFISRNFWANISAISSIILLSIIVNVGISMGMQIISLFFTKSMSVENGTYIVAAIAISITILSQVINFLIQTINQIAIMMVYYSQKEEKENIKGNDEIDKIGLSEV